MDGSLVYYNNMENMTAKLFVASFTNISLGTKSCLFLSLLGYNLHNVGHDGI